MNTISYAYRQFSLERFPLPTELQVHSLERRMNLTLPDDYRQFILEFNGGIFTEPDIEMEDGSRDDRLTALYGIGASYPDGELENLSNVGLFDNNDPPQILPIGSTITGSLIILVLRPEDSGVICYKKAYGDFYFMADGIEEFFAMLREPEDEIG
jgi:hypothetical protein